mgnify:CR=1 FL=1
MARHRFLRERILLRRTRRWQKEVALAIMLTVAAIAFIALRCCVVTDLRWKLRPMRRRASPLHKLESLRSVVHGLSKKDRAQQTRDALSRLSAGLFPAVRYCAVHRRRSSKFAPVMEAAASLAQERCERGNLIDA